MQTNAKPPIGQVFLLDYRTISKNIVKTWQYPLDSVEITFPHLRVTVVIPLYSLLRGDVSQFFVCRVADLVSQIFLNIVNRRVTSTDSRKCKEENCPN